MKFLKTTTLMCIALISFSACEESTLEVKPSTSVTIDQAFTDAAIFESYIIGMYDELFDGNYMPRLTVSMDVQGGDVLVYTARNFNRYPREYNFDQTPNGGYSSDVWFQAYDVIGLANPAILAIPDAPLTDAQKALFEAELRAFRAVSLHNLTRLFGKPYSAGRDNPSVVLNTEVLDPTAPGLGRSTVGEVYDQIVIDLERAVTLMPASRSDRSRWTLKAIQGMLARVYLDMEMWQEAADNAELASDGVTLMTATEWQDGFYVPNSEWIMYGGKTADDSNGFVSSHSFWDSRRLGYSSMRLGLDFIDNNFTATDIRGDSLLLKNSAGDPIVQDAYITKKLFHGEGFVNQEVFMRATEMLLIEAEAKAQLGGAANILDAQNALLTIQQRADENVLVSSGNTGQALLEEIYLERRKELYAEGHAYFDLQRLQRPVTRSAAGGHYASPLDVPFDATVRLAPIPQFELDANEVIRDQQNPGYGS